MTPSRSHNWQAVEFLTWMPFYLLLCEKHSDCLNCTLCIRDMTQSLDIRPHLTKGLLPPVIDEAVTSR